MAYYDVVQLSMDVDFRQRIHAAAVANEVPDPEFWVQKYALWVSLDERIRAAWEYAIQFPYQWKNAINPAVISDKMLDDRINFWKGLPETMQPNPPINTTYDVNSGSGGVPGRDSGK